MEPAAHIINGQRQKYARHTAGLEFAHGKQTPSHEQRREDLEHVIIVGLADFEPFAGIKRSALAGLVKRRLAMAIENLKHLVSAGDTLEYFAE